MATEVITNVTPVSTATYAAPAGVRLEVEDEIRGTYNILFYGKDSLRLGLDLLRAYLAHCRLWLREKFTPFSSR